MRTRAKFECKVVEDWGTSKKVKLAVVTAGKYEYGNTENANFSRYTPSGEIWMTVDNPAASVQFIPGAEYYVTFEAAKPAEA